MSQEVFVKKYPDGQERQIDDQQAIREIRKYCSLDAVMLGVCLRKDGVKTPEGTYFLKASQRREVASCPRQLK